MSLPILSMIFEQHQLEFEDCPMSHHFSSQDSRHPSLNRDYVVLAIEILSDHLELHAMVTFVLNDKDRHIPCHLEDDVNDPRMNHHRVVVGSAQMEHDSHLYTILVHDNLRDLDKVLAYS